MAALKRAPTLMVIAWLMPGDGALRKQLVDLLTGGNAHASFEATVEKFPVDRAGEKVSGWPHSAWELLEHLRIAQEDILRFAGGPSHGYVELKWPDEYWPGSATPANTGDWDRSVAAFHTDLQKFFAMIQDSNNLLDAPFAWGTGQTLLRQALLLADHNAYHVGQLMLIRRALEASH